MILSKKNRDAEIFGLMAIISFLAIKISLGSELTIDSLWIRKFTCVEYKRCPFCLLTLLLVHQ
jgi:hypothetical protein